MNPYSGSGPIAERIFTPASIIAVIGAALIDSATIDFTYDPAVPSITAIVKDDSIIFSKMQNINTQRVLGRNSGGVGDVEEVTATQELDWLSNTNNRILFRSAGVWTSSANLTFDGTTLAVTGLNNTGNTVLGDAAGDTITYNAGTWTLGNAITATRAVGVAASVTGVTQVFTGQVDASGVATHINHNFKLTNSGVNAGDSLRTIRTELTHAGGGLINELRNLDLSTTISSTGNATSVYGIISLVSLTNSGSATGNVRMYSAQAPVLSSTGTIATIIGYESANLGHATLITNAFGFRAADITGSVTLTAGFKGDLTAGTGKWNTYMLGTANNAFAGNVRIGSVVAPTVALDVTGAALISTTLGVTGTLTASGNLGVNGNTTLGDAAADTLTINAGTWTYGNDWTATRAAGVIAAGTVVNQTLNTTFTGDAGGTTDNRSMRFNTRIQGANAVAQALVLDIFPRHDGAATLSQMIGASAFCQINTTANVTTGIGFLATPSVANTGSYTSTFQGFSASGPSFGSTGTINTYIGFQSSNLGNALVTNAYGFNASDITGATGNMMGFRGLVSAGVNKYNLSMTGTADNVLNGNTRIGATASPTVALDITGSLIVSNNTTLGDASGDTLTINAGTWTYGSNFTATRAAGTVAAGVVTLTSYNESATGDVGGTSDVRGKSYTLTLQGANAIAGGYGLVQNLIHSGTNTLTSGNAQAITILLNAAGNLTTATGKLIQFQLTAAGGITTATAFLAGAPTISSTGTINTLHGFRTANLGNATFTNVLAYDAADITAGITLTAGYRSQITSGTGKWGFYASGTANNAFSGNVRIGSVVAPTVTLDVTGSLTVTGTSILGDADADLFTVRGISTMRLDASAADSNILRLINNFGTANSAVVVSFDPGNNGFGVRDAQIKATNNGSNAITMTFLVANGAAPATALTIAPTLAATFAGALSVNGNTTLGDASGDTITFTGRMSSNILFTTDNANDIGATGANRPRDLFIARDELFARTNRTSTALATNMTDGFHNIAGAAGTPTGVPSVTTGFPIYFDSTNDYLYHYDTAWIRHKHDAADITAGTIATARLGSGTANDGSFLRGDQTWAKTWNVIIKAADESRTSTITITDDTELTLALAANTKYKFRITIHIQASTVGFRWRLNGPTTPTVIEFSQYYESIGNVGGALPYDTFNAYHAADQTTGITAAGSGIVRLDGVIHNAGNTGNLRIQWAQAVSNGTAVKIRAGSTFEWMKLP